jgi:hypothetical protein
LRFIPKKASRACCCLQLASVSFLKCRDRINAYLPPSPHPHRQFPYRQGLDIFHLVFLRGVLLVSDADFSNTKAHNNVSVFLLRHSTSTPQCLATHTFPGFPGSTPDLLVDFQLGLLSIFMCLALTEPCSMIAMGAGDDDSAFHLNVEDVYSFVLQ